MQGSTLMQGSVRRGSGFAVPRARECKRTSSSRSHPIHKELQFPSKQAINQVEARAPKRAVGKEGLFAYQCWGGLICRPALAPFLMRFLWLVHACVGRAWRMRAGGRGIDQEPAVSAASPRRPRLPRGALAPAVCTASVFHAAAPARGPPPPCPTPLLVFVSNNTVPSGQEGLYHNSAA